MTPYYEDPLVTLLLGDCLERMRELPDASVDAVVTDPPYGLSFMGKHWDHGVPGVDFWREMWRVAKPGAYLLSFAGTRTVHRFGVAIEDAGWEIRDELVWIYASGFPKSLDVSKAMDRAAGAEREVVGENPNVLRSRHHRNGTVNTYNVADADGAAHITAPSTDLAREWDGWGTALKPAHEPIVMARKPLVGTVAGNVERYGTGALNIDGTRIPSTDDNGRETGKGAFGLINDDGWEPTLERTAGSPLGRWPSNVLLSDPDLFDEPNPYVVGSGAVTTTSQPGTTAKVPKFDGEVYNESNTPQIEWGYGDFGGYSRFFTIPQSGTMCSWCGARNVGLSSSPDERPAATAPSGVATSPDGTPDSMATEDGATTTEPTASGFWPDASRSMPSTLSEPQPATSPRRSPSSRVNGAAPRSTSSATTTTTPSRWMCDSCVVLAIAESTPEGIPAGFVDSPVARGTYPRALIIPKADRAERERGLADRERRSLPFNGHSDHSAGLAPGSVEAKMTTSPRANVHPTVKPIDLMRHLVRLVTPPGGVVLDPFLGSGTTCLAASEEGFRSIGIEREAEYLEIAKGRLIATPMGLGLVS